MVRREAEALRSLLERLLPEYRAKRNDVTLASASPPVAAFWDVIGYSTAFRPFVQDPDEASGRREVEHVLEGWRARRRQRGPIERLRALLDRRGEIDLERLPLRFRFVGVSERWDAIDVTDERAGDDPPIVRVTREPAGVARTGETYLRRTVQGLLEKAVAVSGCELSFEPEVRGEAVLPTLSPELTRLAEGIWRLRTPGREPRVAFDSWDRLCEYVASTATAIRSFHTTNGCFVPIKPELKDAVLATGTWREFRSEGRDGAQVELVGSMEGMPAWITLEPGTEAFTGMSVSNEHRDRLLAWIEARAATS